MSSTVRARSKLPLGSKTQRVQVPKYGALGRRLKGVQGSFKEVWGLINGRFRSDYFYENYMTVSANWGFL